MPPGCYASLRACYAGLPALPPFSRLCTYSDRAGAVACRLHPNMFCSHRWVSNSCPVAGAVGVRGQRCSPMFAVVIRNLCRFRCYLKWLTRHAPWGRRRLRHFRVDLRRLCSNHAAKSRGRNPTCRLIASLLQIRCKSAANARGICRPPTNAFKSKWLAVRIGVLRADALLACCQHSSNVLF